MRFFDFLCDRQIITVICACEAHGENEKFREFSVFGKTIVLATIRLITTGVSTFRLLISTIQNYCLIVIVPPGERLIGDARTKENVGPTV